MQFLCSPVIGSLSDRYGRRPVILISAAGLSIDWVLMALAPNLWWLAVGRLIGGGGRDTCQDLKFMPWARAWLLPPTRP